MGQGPEAAAAPADPPAPGSPSRPQAGGLLTLEELARRVDSGEIDTVATAFTDMQGRLLGKRVAARFFLDEAARHGIHFCNYLLGTDMEMTCPPGYRRMGWEQGYGDWLAVPDLGTLRVIPWLPGTALVICDVADGDGRPVALAPRQMLRDQVARAAALGLRPLMASEVEFYLLRETYEGARRKHFHDLEPFGWFLEDYHLLQGAKAEPLYRQVRRGLEGAGVPVESSKGEAGTGQHEINLRYADALEAADRHTLLKQALKEIGMGSGLAVTFMAKPDHTWTGSSCHIHASLWSADLGRPLFPEPADASGRTPSSTMSAFLAGQVACGREFALLFAPNVNSYKRYAAESWAPVNLAWARDNRTCGLRVVGRGPGLRLENRLPGADANPYLAFAAVLAAGLHGIRQRLQPPPEFAGNAYEAAGLPRLPGSLAEAAALWEGGAAARAAFGTEVVEHYAHAGRLEQAAYDRAVTCWERERYFERI